jgi:pimeloyl-ACP methyl ester carboxylesterase
MENLGITNAYVMGISMGGMIAQYLAIDHQGVEKLVLCITLSRQNETLQKVIKNWIELAKVNDYKNLVIDSIEKTYTDNYLRQKKYRQIYPILTRIGKPKDFTRYLIQANACIKHNAFDELDKITCPTLVIGGDSDLVVGKNTSEELAEKIKGSKLIIYKGLGHGTFAEAKDFDQQVLNFLKT